MCEKCEDTITRVARVLGRDVDVVREIHDAIADDMERTNEDAARRTQDELSSVLGRSVRPYLLGVEPFILITVGNVREASDGTHADVATLVGGGLPEEMIGDILRRSADAWELRATGGVTESGALVTWMDRKS